MTYVCSDLHGFYGEYLDFVESVLTDEDELYIIGDVLNRGFYSIELVKDIMNRPNAVLLAGNHEKLLKESFEELCYAYSTEAVNSIIAESLSIDKMGQEQTLLDFAKLSKNEQHEILNFISNLPIYKELSVNNKDYLLVHAGLPDFSGMPIEWYEEDDILFGPHDFDETHYEDTTIIVGHVPTRFITGATPDKIFRKNDTIAVDCGLGFGGQLGVLCLDNDEEFYF